LVLESNLRTNGLWRSDLVCVLGGWGALAELPVSTEARLGVAQARGYEDAMRKYPGFLASRRNYDVVGQRIDNAGRLAVRSFPRTPALHAREVFTGPQPDRAAFSKLKAHLRKAAEHTILRLLRRIGRIVTDFSPQEDRNFFRHAGYART
jgi:uncharacterized protein DUF3182